jgi:hypothetical protein
VYNSRFSQLWLWISVSSVIRCRVTFHVQGRKEGQTNNKKQASRSPTPPSSGSKSKLYLMFVHASCLVFALRPSRWRHYVPPRRWWSTRQYGVTSQNIKTFLLVMCVAFSSNLKTEVIRTSETLVKCNRLYDVTSHKVFILISNL